MKMKVILVLTLAVSFSCWANADEATRMTNPNAVGVEILGRSLLYSVFYDRVMNDDMAAGFGIGSVSTQFAGGGDAGVSATMVPAYLNYYFTRTGNSLYATGGVSLITNASSVTGLKSSTGGYSFNNNSVEPNFGAGFESRGDSGFLFRVAGYGLIGAKVIPWMGFSFGYAF